MLLPKFDILNKIKKERTITLANAIIIAFAAFVVFTVLQTLGIVNLFLLATFSWSTVLSRMSARFRVRRS